MLPPSDARPACISTVMASATCLSFAIGVPHFSSNSLSIAMALAHRPELRIRWRAISTAAAQTVAAHTTAAPTATFPITTTNNNNTNYQSIKLSRRRSIQISKLRAPPKLQAFPLGGKTGKPWSILWEIAWMFRDSVARVRERGEEILIEKLDEFRAIFSGK